MKSLKQILQEKLTIGKNLTVKNKEFVFDQIMQYLPQEVKQTNKYNQYIENWIKDENVTNFKPCVDLETYNVIKTHDMIDSKFLPNFDTSYDTNEQCQNDCDWKNDILYDLGNYSIYGNSKELVISSWFGTIYFVKL